MSYEILWYEDVAIPAGMAWSSPFAKRPQPATGMSALDLAADVTGRALAARGVDPELVEGLVLGWTIPQPDTWRGAAALAARLGASGVSGPMVSQACATSVACLAAAAGAVTAGAGLQLVIATDQASSVSRAVGLPLSFAGDGPCLANWVLDNRARDPGTGMSALDSADAVAAEAGISRGELDDLAVLRHGQYARALSDDRSFQRRYMVRARTPRRGQPSKAVEGDAGIRPATIDEIALLAPSAEHGLHTCATQACPADGTAGTLVTTVRHARELARGAGVVQIRAIAFARVAPGRMPQAALPAAQAALDGAGLAFRGIDAVTTHSPFAVSDICLSRQTGVPLEKTNAYGCSLVFGHPQGPTGLRSVAELIEELRQRGGGTGLFTGCATGDTGAAVVLCVHD